MSSAGSWAGNPYNKVDSLKQNALPKILFEECHKNCVDFDFAAPQNESEVKCIKNCQEKTYQAFDMYMRVQYNFAKNTTWRDHIDVSKYTGMEVEHGLNTAGLVPMGNASNAGHYDPTAHGQNNAAAFRENINKKLGGVQAAAL